ncbi:MAG: RNase H1/viroplasmin domain-containing protein [Rhodothermales bacterium]
MAKTPKWYVVFVGRRTGIFTSWYGPGGAQAQIHRFSGAAHESYESAAAAREAWQRWKHGEPADCVRVVRDGQEVEFPLEGPLYQFLRANGFLP